MPTNRTRTSRGRRAPPIDANDWAFLIDETPQNPFTQFRADSYWRALWAEHGGQIVADWARRHPGTRPQRWWMYDAPRLAATDHKYDPECHFVPNLIHSRKQLGGSGVPAYAVMAVVPHWELGIPSWMEEVDESNPPVFESQLDYLKRHGLLLPGEEKRTR
jgi:hypothetical protein